MATSTFLAIGLITYLAGNSPVVPEESQSPGKHPGNFKVTTRKPEDAVEVRSEPDKVVFAVKSPSGIGQAVIERLDGQWPKAVVLRLHLKGLESFRVSNGKVRLDAAVSMQGGQPKVRLWKDGQETPALDENSPFWMAIRIIGGDEKPAKELPLKGGYFEMTLPQAFVAGNPRSLTLNWIDFYRR